MSDTVYHCSICGHRGVLLVEDTRGVRDNYRCENCRSMTMQRDVAQIVVDEFGSGRFLDLRRLVASGDLDNLDIYEVGMIGPISTRLKVLPRYTQSYYWEDLPVDAFYTDYGHMLESSWTNGEETKTCKCMDYIFGSVAYQGCEGDCCISP